VKSQLIAAEISAGGAGRRQGGRDKTQLLIGGQTILDRQLALLTPLFSRVLLVLGPAATAGPADPAGSTRGPAPASGPASAPLLPPASPSVTVVRDRAPAGSGPLAGLDAALSALDASAGETAVVCVAGDMPLLTPALLQLVRDTCPSAAAVVPRLGGHAEPLLARYGIACAPAIKAALAARALKTSAVLDQLAVAWLDEPALRAADPQLLSFENANTPADLARIEALASAGRPPG
jgi:molybdopterin-guanine dinucleotide biosynthesis protein A